MCFLNLERENRRAFSPKLAKDKWKSIEKNVRANWFFIKNILQPCSSGDLRHAFTLHNIYPAHSISLR